MNNTLGLYIHIPFCQSKCRYCDFYSLKQSNSTKQSYVNSLKTHLKLWGEQLAKKTVDTIYFGGGTPSELTVNQLNDVLLTVKAQFPLTQNCEITLEVNPEHLTKEYCMGLKETGINRVSVGMQSCNNQTLQLIGRRHTATDVVNGVKNLKQAGITNISLDIIGGLPREDEMQLKESIDFALGLNIPHLSFYLLKLEPNTYFYNHKDEFTFAGDDKQADLYLFAANYIESLGLPQYEISNFAKKGFESKHNLKYWKLKDYLGLGPSAHSMVNNKRFYYKRDLQRFLSSNTLKNIVQDGAAQPIEYLMLSLRLKSGFHLVTAKEQFSLEILPRFFKTVDTLEKNGLVVMKDNILSLTKEGFLVSNSIISALADCIT